MAETETNTPSTVVERNITLVGHITQYLLDHPEVFSALPDEFELVVLPDDDPEIRQHNLELLDEVGTNKPIVFARLHSQRDRQRVRPKPSFFVPIAAAV
jgi:hypothetical protein